MKKTAFRRRLIFAALAAASLCASAALNSGIERQPHRRVVADTASEGRVIVKFRADAGLAQALAASGPMARPRHAERLSGRIGATLVDGRALGPRTQVLKAPGLNSRELADRLSTQADVEYAVVDGRKFALAAPNDPLYAGGQGGTVVPTGQWYLRAPTSATIADANSIVSSINAEAAWDVANGSGVVVAVLDTGVRFDHPDLAGKFLPGYDFIRSLTVSKDGDLRDADASDPGDFGCAETTSSWHGTQTSGLIGAATDNGVGMAGVGRNVMILPARVLGCGGGFDSDIQAAMLWSAGIPVPDVPANPNPAKVLNLSLGSTGACNAAYTSTIAQVNAAGAVVVVASGNDGKDVGTPANCAGAIAVAGVRHAGTKVGYSDLGPSIAIAAPAGNCVNDANGPCVYALLTTSNSGTTTPVAGAGGATYTGRGADASLGTSFSAPLVAGAAALIYSANPSMTARQVLAALQVTSRTFPTSGAAPIRQVSGGPLVPVAACNAPGDVAQDFECYCTTSTCGAGLLDVSAATSAAATVNASVAAPPAATDAGGVVTLDGSASWPSPGATLTYQWSIVSGPGNLTSSTGPSATLQTTTPGTVVVKLTTTDSAGRQDTSNVTVVVAEPAPVVSGGGGGGAMNLGWLLGWLASVIAVWSVTPRRRG